MVDTRFWQDTLHPLSRWIRPLGACLFVLAIVPANGQITSSALPSSALVHVRVTRPESPQIIPSTVFGSFLEPINSAVYGGLWADVVENGSFEEGLWSLGNLDSMLHDRPELRRASELGLPTPWEPLHLSDGNRYLSVRGDAANAAQSVLIMSLPGKEVGLSERVYLPAERELHYSGALWIKHVRGNTDVRVALRRHSHAETVFASVSIAAKATGWARYPFELTLKDGQLSPLEPADLTISVEDDGRAMIDQVTFQPADNISGLDPDMVHRLQSLHSPLLRFGGNFTSAYDWHDGIGPAEKRVPKQNASWGIPEYNSFGTDEFLRLCELIHAEPQIALNLGTGTPEAAAEWVHYVNEHFGDHRGGLLWELGNELWGDYQIGYPSQERVADVTRTTSRAIHAVDPRARLIATGADQDNFRSWNATQLSSPPGTFQYLSTHFVIRPETNLANAAPDFRALAALALPVGLDRQLHAIHEQIAASPNKGVKTAFTEWLIIGDDAAPVYSNMGGALFAGGFLNTILRDSGFVPIADMTGNIEFGGLTKKRGKVFPAPAFWILQTYATARPHTLLSTQSDGPTYTVSHGINHLTDIADVPYFDVVATEAEDGKHVLLFCVNRSLTAAANVALTLSAFHVGSGSMRVTTISSDSIYAQNSEETPDRVKPVVSVESVQPGTIAHTFPSASVTVLEIPIERD